MRGNQVARSCLAVGPRLNQIFLIDFNYGKKTEILSPGQTAHDSWWQLMIVDESWKSLTRLTTNYNDLSPTIVNYHSHWPRLTTLMVYVVDNSGW